MFFIMLLLWIVFNGKITVEILLFGIGICGVIYGFMCKVMGYGMQKELRMSKVILPGILYLVVLVIEIIKANLTMIKEIIFLKPDEPGDLASFTSNLKGDGTRVALASSITLTPGTITVVLDDGNYLVHGFNKAMTEGLDSSVFVKRLERMEEKLRGNV